MARQNLTAVARRWVCSTVFFINTTPTTGTSTLSLHDALPISPGPPLPLSRSFSPSVTPRGMRARRSEERTSELQSPDRLVCRFLLEKKHHRDRGRAVCALQLSLILYSPLVRATARGGMQWRRL